MKRGVTSLLLALVSIACYAAVLAAQTPAPAAPTSAAPPAITASPNPVPAGAGLGATTITWTTGDGSPGRVLVSVNGADAKLFASGAGDSSRADWIQSGARYEFRLYRDATPDVLAASVVVTRPVPAAARTWTRTVPLIVLAVATLILGYGIATFARRRSRVAEQLASTDPDPIHTWEFEFGAAGVVGACLWIKLVYSARLMVDIPPDGQMIGSASLAIVLITVAPLLLLPRMWRLVPLFLLDVAVSFVLLADELYFRRYLDIITVADLASAPVLLQGFANSVILALFRPVDLVYGLDLAAMLVGAIFYVQAARRYASVSFGPRTRVAGWLLAIGIAVGTPTLWMLWERGFAARNEAYRGEIAGTIGLLPYHLYEAATSLTAPTEPAPDLTEIRQFLDARREASPRSPLFGAAAGKNLILIQAESLQGFPVGLVVDGQPVTPNLSAFAAESLHFVNFFDQTHHGYTSDGEFTSLSSLHPLPGGSASVTLRTNHYRSLPAILDAEGYVTLSACASNGSVWSMAMMHPNHGFELSLFEDQFDNLEYFHLLSDGQFFSQMLHRITAEPRPFMVHLVTSSNHAPFDIPERYRTLRLTGALAHGILGDYLQSVHYFDRVFGEFIEGLRTSGVLDDTVVAIYGDHQAYLEYPKEITALGGFPDGSEYHQWLVEKRIPFLVRLPHGEHAGVVNTPTGHLDIAPTLLGLLGAADDDRVMFGKDATSGTPPLVVFRDGSFASDRADYTLPHDLLGKPTCYEPGSGRVIECAPLEADHQRALEELRISDAVLNHDLIPTLVNAPIPKTVADLAPPHAYSSEFGVDHVVTSAFDILAPAPSGATFSVDNGGGTVRVLFAPIIDVGARATETDGVIFEIWSGSALLYHQLVLPANMDAVAVDVPPVPGHARTEISFVTKAVAGSTGAHHATWQRVRFLTGTTARTSSNSRPINRR